MKAVVLSGGGSKGAYQAGVLKRLIGDLKTDYDIVCGTSVGALNGAFLCSDDSLENISDGLISIWSNLTTGDISKNWFLFGKLASLWKGSMYDSSPLRKFLEHNLSSEKIKKSGKKYRIGATNMSTGEYQIFTEDYDDLVTAILASSAFPAIYGPVKIGSDFFVDGVIRETTPITMAIDSGATEIDIIITNPEGVKQGFVKKPSVFDLTTRSVDILIESVMDFDLFKVQMYNNLVAAGIRPDKRYVKMRIFRPYGTLTDDATNFNPDKIRDMIDIGYEDAKSLTL